MIRRYPTKVWSRRCSKACSTKSTTNGTGEVSDTGKAVSSSACGFENLGVIVMPALCDRMSTDKETPRVCQYPPMLKGGMWKASLAQVQQTFTVGSTAPTREHPTLNANTAAGSSRPSRTAGCELDERARHCCKHMTPLYQGYLHGPVVPMPILAEAEPTVSQTKHWLLDGYITANSSRTADCTLKRRAGYCCKHMTPLYQGHLRAPGVPMSILTEAESTACTTKHWLLDAYIIAGSSNPSRAGDCTSNEGAGRCLKSQLQVWSSTCTAVTTTLAAESTALKDGRWILDARKTCSSVRSRLRRATMRDPVGVHGE